MNKSQRIITQIHQEFGVSDAEIAKLCAVSREHINRVKQGKRIASNDLTELLEAILQLLREDHYKPTRKHYEWKRAEPEPAKPAIIPSQPAQVPTHTLTAAPWVPTPQSKPVLTLPELVGTAKLRYKAGNFCRACLTQAEVQLYELNGHGNARLCEPCAIVWGCIQVLPTYQPYSNGMIEDW